jgi:RND superfamily putative drug exporter
MNHFFSLLGQFIFDNRRNIVIIWLIGLIFSIYFIINGVKTNQENELSGLETTEAYQVMNVLKNNFDHKLGTNLAIVFDKKIETNDIETELLSNFKEIKKIGEITSNIEHKNKLLYLEFYKEKSFVEVYKTTPKIRELLKKWSNKTGVRAMVTGNPAFQHDGSNAGKKESTKTEILALIFSLFILIYTFEALISAVIPLIIGITTIVYLNGIVKFLALDINTLSQILTGLIGLALAIDYSLFIISRYNEERKTKDILESIKIVFMFPVKAIIVSSLIMACSMSVLLIPDVSTSRVVVTNIFISIFISLLNSMIILPALIIYFDKLLDKPKFINDLIKKADSYNFWKKITTHITDFPKRYFILSLFILLFLSYPVSKLKVIESVYALTPENTESIQAYKELEKDNWGGELMPVTLIIKAKKDNDVYSKEYISFIYDLTEYLKTNSDVKSVQSITSFGENLKKQDYINILSSTYTLNLFFQNNLIPLINTNKGNNLSIMNVYSKDMLDINKVHDLIREIKNYSKQHNQYEVLTGGVVARAQDFSLELYGYIPLMLTIIFFGIYLILFFYMKSIVLPIKAGIMNFLPILSSFGILTLVFQFGFFNDFLLIKNSHGVINMVPIILFCIIFGLSMDYEVLILSRITEVYEQSGNVKYAIVEGLARSGNVITGAALILFAVFFPGIFSSSPPTKQICIGISSAVLIDATIVRLMLVPSFMMLMGKWNWYKFSIEKK